MVPNGHHNCSIQKRKSYLYRFVLYVASNNIYRKLIRLLFVSRIRFTETNVSSFKVLICAHMFAFISRISNSGNELIRNVNNSCKCKYSKLYQLYIFMAP